MVNGGGRLTRLLERSLLRQLAIFVIGIGFVEALDLTVLRPVPQGEMVFGAMIGIVYALIAVGLILVYQANRIINFAIAEFGVFGAILYQNLRGQAKVPWAAALVIGVASAALFGFVMERFLARRFAESSRLILTVVTIGMAQFAAFGEIEVSLHFGTIPAAAGLKTPFSGLHFTVGGEHFDGNLIVLVVAAVLILVALEFFLHRTDYGVAVRAAAENGPRASLLGIPVRTASTIAWVIAATIAGLATILESPMTGVVAGGTVVGPTLLYKALTVAVIAGFADLRVALLAGVFLGTLEQSITYAYSGSTVSDALFVAIAIVVLLFRPQRRTRIIEATTSTWRSIREIRRVPVAVARERRVVTVRAASVLVIGALLVAGPLGLGGAHLFDAQEALLFGIVAISCVVVTGWTGQISLGQFAFAAVGAVIAGKLYSEAHWDFFASMLGGGAAAAAASTALGAVATRVRGFLFAVTSLGFAIALESYFFNPRFVSWLIPAQGYINLTRPVLFGRFNLSGDLAYYYVCLATLVLVGWSVSVLRRSRTGRVLVALKDNDRAARSYGVSQVRSLLSAFALSGFIAGIGGCLFAFHAGAVDPGDYAASQSVTVFSMAVIGGLGSVPSAVLGASLIEGWGFAFGQNQALEALGTAAGLSIVLLFIPEGIGSLVYRLRDLALGRFSPEKMLSPTRRATGDLGTGVAEEVAANPYAAVPGVADGPLLAAAPPTDVSAVTP